MADRPSTANFSAIFETALNEYKTRTGQDLRSHPFAICLENNNSSDAILEIFRKQAQAFDKFRGRDDKLMACLAPVVDILFALSPVLGEGIGLVRPPFFHFSMFKRLFFSHFLQQRRSLLVLVFSSGYISHSFSALLPPNIHNAGSEGRHREL
jgi:hypothetical protein